MRAAEESVTYRQVLRNREFRGLLLAQVASEVGDNIARVALATLLLARSGSLFVAAFAFAASYLPAAAGSLMLAPWADRLPRKRLMVTCDVVRAPLIACLALLAVPGVPLWLLLVLLFAAEAGTPPFDAARSALLPDVLADPREYLAGAALSRVVFLLTQVAGLALGGLLAGLLSPRVGLALDALTFVVSALLVLASVRARPAAIVRPAVPVGWFRDVTDGLRLVLTDPVRRSFVFFAWAAALFLVAPEGVALAYARNHGAPELGGALLATIPLGAALGAAAVSRWAPATQLRLILPLAGLACLPLVATLTAPPTPVAMILWLASGLCQAFMVTVIATVNLVTPAHFRGRVNGIAAAGFSSSTAAAFLFAGLLGDATSPAVSVAVAGLLGLLMVAVAAARWPWAAVRAVAEEGSRREAGLSSSLG
jgi:MFS family permease